MQFPFNLQLTLQAFVDHYYNTFDTARSSLASLYSEQAMLTFEGSETQGQQAILQKLTSLPFQQCKHHVATLDVQPSPMQGGIMVFVTGQLLVGHALLSLIFPACGLWPAPASFLTVLVVLLQTEGESQPLKFSQIFHLVASGNSFALSNGKDHRPCDSYGCLSNNA